MCPSPSNQKAGRDGCRPTRGADLIAAFGIDKGLVAGTATQRPGLTFLLAHETAFQSGEILPLTWPNVHLSE